MKGREKLKKIIFLIFLFFFFSCLTVSLPIRSDAIGEKDVGVVYVLKIDGVITEGTHLQITEGLREAEKIGAEAVLIEIDTPGGLVSSTCKITESILNSKIPVITYVTPRGAIAASAGSFILISANIAAMSPGTTVGAAMPVSVTTEGLTKAEEKTVKFFAAHMESIAASKGRNATQVKLFVTENEVLNESLALDRGIIDFIAEDEKDLLSKVDGVVVKIENDNRTLETKGTTFIVKNKGVRSFILEIISNPQIAIILLIIGIYGLVFGFISPGTYVPEMIGAICLVLALYGIGLFHVNIFGVLLIILAIILFIAEALTPSFGILTTGALACLIIGALIMPKEPLIFKPEWFESFLFTIIGIAISSAAFFLFALGAVLKVRKRKSVVGMEELIGKVTKAETEITEEEGFVKIRGEIWYAQTRGEKIKKGKKVEIVDREGLRLIVKKKEP